MKFKITVELEEGVKNSQFRSITSELILVSLKDKGRLREVMINEAKNGAANCMGKIFDFITDNPGTIVLAYDKDGKQEVHLVKDVDEVPQACWDYIELHEIKKRLFTDKALAKQCANCRHYFSWNCPKSCPIVKKAFEESAAWTKEV